MTAQDRKNWLSFVQLAAALPQNYTVAELRAYHKIALTQFPSMAPLIIACIGLAETGEIHAKNVTANAQTDERRTPSDPLVGLFSDVKAFPRNADLVRFAQSNLPDMPDHRFDKMSRVKIAHRVADHVKGLDAEARNNLLDLIKKNSTARKEGPSFFSKWEQVIKAL